MINTKKVIKVIISETLGIDINEINDNTVIKKYSSDNKLLQFELNKNLYTEFEMGNRINLLEMSINQIQKIITGYNYFGEIINDYFNNLLSKNMNNLINKKDIISYLEKLNYNKKDIYDFLINILIDKKK